MKKRISEAGACLAVYILLILLLTAAESGAGGSIRNWTDAVWYSVVTMTTVGYGDLYPVSPAGRIIGFVFLLLSLGFLAFIISAAVSGLKERWMPQLKLLRRKKRTWFVFSEKNGAAEILAEELTENHPGAIAVFCKTEGGTSDGKICVPFGIEALCGRKVFCSGERKLFFISEDASENRQEAQQLNSCGQAYCFSPETDGIPGVRFFDIAEACARTYWKRYPLEPGEGPVALIGDGRFARALADQAVCVNCMTPFASDSYFLHGDWSVYRQLHPQLERGPKAEGSAEFFFMETRKTFAAPEVWAKCYVLTYVSI
ncbi:MAG: potassium channel family protein [Clostridia bacterium]|nr:potassium channel family protein [Clostridia bacterium]